MRFASALALSTLVALGAASAGCPAETGNGSTSSGTSGSTCDYSPPAGFDALSPAVTFSGDVKPIFARSCAFTTCHGSSTGPANGVFLGGTDNAKVIAAIVNVKGDEHPTMPFVTPGNPRESYLMRKMDGSQCALDAQCSGASCQSSMPKGDVPLEVATRDVVRRWIAQGAKND